MQPPATGSARSMRKARPVAAAIADSTAGQGSEPRSGIRTATRALLSRAQARVRQSQPLDHDRHEGAVEAVPASFGRAIEILGADGDDARVAHRRDIRDAQL